MSRTPAPAAVIALILLFALPASGRAQPLHRLEGRVLNAATGDALPSANVRILGTGRGTISNREGDYLIRVPEGRQQVVFSFIGFASDTLDMDFRGDRHHEARLNPTVIPNPTIVVVGEDLARNIVRRAIEAKETLREGLESYRFQAYTRRSISREDSIAGIVESYTNGFWRRGEQLREQVRQTRATENLPELESELAGVFDIQDFSLDDLELVGNNYIGPLHRNALRWYDYTLEEVNLQDGLEIYRIAMEPRSKLVPLLRGTIDIADSSWALVGIDLVPAEAVVFPFIKDLQVHWRQDFRRQESGYWLPTDVRMDGGIRVELGPIKIPRIGFDQTSILYSYEVNAAIPDSLFERSVQIVELPEAATIDSTFWKQNEVLPLTGDEEYAYATLDSTKTLERQFAPPGFDLEAGDGQVSLIGGRGGDAVGTLLSGLDSWYNRVEGTHIGYRVDVDSIAGPVNLFARGGIGLSSDLWTWEVNLSSSLGRRRGIRFGFWYYDHIAESPDAGFYPTILNTITTLLAKDDYPDYYRSRGWRSELGLGRGTRPRLDLYFARERHRSLPIETNYSLFQRSQPSRLNPLAEEGELDRLGARVRIGQPENEAAGVITARGIGLWAERGSGTVAGEDRTWTRVDGVVSYALNTVTGRFMFSPQLVLRLAGGWSEGGLPSQLRGSPETAMGIYGPLGTLRGARPRELAGDRYVVLTAEHNFRNLPFLLLGLRGLSEKGLEVLIHGGIARAWRDQPGADLAIPADRPYLEAGFGLGRVLEMVRIDLTRRLVAPTGWSVSIALTTFF